MTNLTTFRRGVHALATTVALCLGATAAQAVTTTIDFGTSAGSVSSPYVEDGFQLTGKGLFTSTLGNPPSSLTLSVSTPTLTLTRVDGGAFDVLSFEYACVSGCNFTAGGVAVPDASTGLTDFVRLDLVAAMNITSFDFVRSSGSQRIDNIVVSSVNAIPLPASSLLLLGGLAGLATLRRRTAGT